MKKDIVFKLTITSHLNNQASGFQLTNEPLYTPNIFCCEINGKPFEPSNAGLSYGPALFGGYSNNFKIVRITAKFTEAHPYKYVIIELNNFHGKGEYLMSEINNDCRYEEFYPDNTYKSNLTGNGKVVITKDDRVNFVISGNFEFTAANSIHPLDIVTVLQGEFYLKF